MIIGAGTLSKFALMELKPRDLMMTAPQVESPPTACKPLRHMSRCGHIRGLVKTATLKLHPCQYGRFHLSWTMDIHIGNLDIHGASGLLERIVLVEASHEDVRLPLRQPALLIVELCSLSWRGRNHQECD